MTWVAVAVAGGSIIGGALQSNAATSAAQTQANAANASAQIQQGEFNTINQQNAPWRQSGQNALGALNAGFGTPGSQYAPLTLGNFQDIQKSLGGIQPDANWANQAYSAYQNGAYGGDPQSALAQLQTNAAGSGYTGDLTQSVQLQPQNYGIDNGYFTHQFNANDLNSTLAPNYQFSLDQGLGAVRNAGNAQSGLISGNTLKGINDYAQNYAQGAYQQAFNNYTGQQTNIFNRLADIAGLGQTANQTTTQSGTTLAGNIGQSLTNAGTAAAGGIVGSANALAGGLNNAASWYTLNSLTNPSGGGGYNQADYMGQLQAQAAAEG